METLSHTASLAPVAVISRQCELVLQGQQISGTRLLLGDSPDSATCPNAWRPGKRVRCVPVGPQLLQQRSPGVRGLRGLDTDGQVVDRRYTREGLDH